MRKEMDIQLARACAVDEGNRSMRKNKRKEWNEDDWNVSVRMFNKLWPIEEDWRKFEEVIK